MTKEKESIQVTAEAGEVLVDLEVAGGVCAITLTTQEALTLSEKLLAAIPRAELYLRESSKG